MALRDRCHSKLNIHYQSLVLRCNKVGLACENLAIYFLGPGEFFFGGTFLAQGKGVYETIG